MKIYLKLIPVLIATFIFTTDIDADFERRKSQSTSSSNCSDENYLGKGPAHEKTQAPAGYSAPARWDLQGNWDIFISGSFIYWMGAQEANSLAISVQSDSPNELGAYSFIDSDFDYKPGFKVAVGTNLQHDNWTFLAEYTRLHYTTTTSADLPSGNNSVLEINNWWEVPNSNIGNTFNVPFVNNRWKVQLDIIDAELARPYFLGRWLVFRPFMGPRAVWLDQEFDASLRTFGGVFINSRWKQDTWGLGPRTGCDVNWEFGYGLKIIGSAAGSLLYRTYEVRQDVPAASNNPTLLSRIRLAKYRFLSPNAEIGMGIGWESYFGNRISHIDIRAAYEFHYWWNENTMRKTATLIDDGLASKAGDLSFHGLTFTVRFDF